MPGLHLDRRQMLGGAVAFAAGSVGAPAILRYAIAQPAAIAVRRPAHALKHGDKLVESFKRAVLAMRDEKLPDYHPAHWEQMRRYHAQLCSPAGRKDANAEIHSTWWFLPWHRAYLAVVEHLMQQASGDATFAIPYWDWMRHPGVPEIFGGDPTTNPLAHARRNIEPIESLNLAWSAMRAQDEAQLVNDDSYAEFAGEAPRVVDGKPVFGNRGTLDPMHANGHLFVGGVKGDMGDFATAPRDPIFLAHHANVDRMWEVWRNSARPHLPRTNPTGAAWAERQFAFQDEVGGALIITSANVVDTTSIRFSHYTITGSPELIVSYRYARDKLDSPLDERVAAVAPGAPIIRGAPPMRSIPLDEGAGRGRITSDRPFVGRLQASPTGTKAGAPAPELPPGTQVAVKLTGVALPSETTLFTTSLRLTDGRRIPVRTDPVIPFRPSGEPAKFSATVELTEILRREHLGLSGFNVEVIAEGGGGNVSFAVDKVSLEVR